MACETKLDHVVINVRQHMDGAAEMCRALGFTVTPRGYHTLGSINHLMIFGTDYFELVGVPAGGEVKRADLMASPVGIDGLVFKTDDADAVYTRLVALGMAGEPPAAFSRPVEIDGRMADAKFRTVTVRADVFPAGRVYFCEHGTPDLVWRPEWQDHENDTLSVAEMVTVTEDVKGAADAFARLVEGEVTAVMEGVRTVQTADIRLTFRRPSGYRAQYGDLATEMAGRVQIFGALVFRVAALSSINARLADMENPPPYAIGSASTVVRLADYDSVLEFVGPEA